MDDEEGDFISCLHAVGVMINDGSGCENVDEERSSVLIRNPEMAAGMVSDESLVSFSFSFSSILIPAMADAPVDESSLPTSSSSLMAESCSLARVLFLERVDDVFSDELLSSDLSTMDAFEGAGRDVEVGDCLSLLRFRLLLLLLPLGLVSFKGLKRYGGGS